MADQAWKLSDTSPSSPLTRTIPTPPSPPWGYTIPTPPRLEYDASTIELLEFGKGWRNEVVGYQGPVIVLNRGARWWHREVTFSAAILVGRKGDNFMWAFLPPGPQFQTKMAGLFGRECSPRADTSILSDKDWTFSPYVESWWNTTVRACRVRDRSSPPDSSEAISAIVLYNTDAAMPEDGGCRRRHCGEPWKSIKDWWAFDCNVPPRFYRAPTLAEAETLEAEGDSITGSVCVQANASKGDEEE
ncbi:hypothetical protein CLAIMM_06579 [Cladophialophora immunda]|nr:hypothetical protein CLAIMM_06579 [Cladophialophora immunda]